ncbi:MAG: hypothetical protein DRN81_01740 [Thermoproteota archaeon]|nr:MAG: hypothetical protein DRN81_01740 [Candidatus Korarchaeota archaeon]
MPEECVSVWGLDLRPAYAERVNAILGFLVRVGCAYFTKIQRETGINPRDLYLLPDLVDAGVLRDFWHEERHYYFIEEVIRRLSGKIRVCVLVSRVLAVMLTLSFTAGFLGFIGYQWCLAVLLSGLPLLFYVWRLTRQLRSPELDIAVRKVSLGT